MSDTPNPLNETFPAPQTAPRPSLWDTTITFRQIRNWLTLCLVVGFVWYVWQFFRLEWHSKMGGLPAVHSPYYAEIPENCQRFSDRHSWFTNTPDSIALRIRPIRRKADYLQPGYGGIRCLGYSVLTGLHMTDSMDADFTDTYTDNQDKPIVRITVEYLQTYSYNTTRRKAFEEKEQQ